MLPVQNRTPMEMVIEPKPATYALILSCTSNARFRSGAWERCNFSAGITFTWGARWVQVACVPGSPTIKSSSTRPHWHIDYLRAHTRLHSVWLSYSGIRHEHEWARAMLKVKDATIPFPGYGASDCSCPSHLYFFKYFPTQIGFTHSVHYCLRTASRVD